ncbi:MAG: alpha/beta hydrolase [Flavobacteriaceae bacterium]|nr:alpha/beta hydrolase [Flavobacteriaceae bacterium]
MYKSNLAVLCLLIFSLISCKNTQKSNTTDNSEITETVPETRQARFLLVHSAWLGGWQWEQVAKPLLEAGHYVFTPDLPGHGTDATPSSEISMERYVKTITDLLDTQKEPVILVGHSFNGITISRVAELRPEKVAKLVYLTAFLLPEGGSFFKVVSGVEGSKAVENFYLTENEEYALVKEAEMHNAFAHDIPLEAFEAAKPSIVPEPVAPLGYELEITDENFGMLPKYYIECTEDRAIPIAVQRSMYQGKVEKVFSLNTSHTPNFSQPGELAKILLEIADL